MIFLFSNRGIFFFKVHRCAVTLTYVTETLESESICVIVLILWQDTERNQTSNIDTS